MIQRIQSVYILISIILMTVMFLWFPVILDGEGAVIVERDEPLVLGLLAGTVLMSFISIFSYKNRKRQMNLNRFNILIHIILLGVFVYQSLMLSGEITISKKGIGVFIPVVSIVFLVLANKAIKRDENLVKSVDRLR